MTDDGDNTTNVASPASHDIIRLTDEGISEYVEFPDDTIFMESLAQNTSYKEGVVYVPAQRRMVKYGSRPKHRTRDGEQQDDDDDEEEEDDGTEKKEDTEAADEENMKHFVIETHLYEVRPGMKEAKHVFGPMCPPKGNRPVTVFGSSLDKNGILSVCAYNRNSVLLYNLNDFYNDDGTIISKEHGEEDTPVHAKAEIRPLPAPNEVAVDPTDDSILYVAGGTRRRLCRRASFNNAARGRLYKVQLNRSDDITRASDGCKITVLQGDLCTLAGIEVLDGNIWVAQLFNMLKVPVDQSNKTYKVWDGNDGKGWVWLADNVDVFDDEHILCPAYTTVPQSAVMGLKTPCLSSTVLFMSLMWSRNRKRGETFSDKLIDPEVSLDFSNTFIKPGIPPEPVRFFIMSPTNNNTTTTTNAISHFQVDLIQTRTEHEPIEIKHHETGHVLGKRHYFNEQVTHAAHLKTIDGSGTGYIVCVNFECPRILLLNDAPFRDHFHKAMTMG